MAHAELLELAAVHCLRASQNVILEGIFNASRYAGMLQRVASVSTDARFYAFDLSFEETAQRHKTREKAATVNVDELRSWYHGWQPLQFVNEQRITADESASQIVERMLREPAQQRDAFRPRISP